jgi:hypothetical protein
MSVSNNQILLSGDVEASGPCPGKGDMISFALIIIEPGLTRYFDSGNMRPECDQYDEGAYRAIGMTREEHLNAPHSIEERMLAFRDWLDAELAEQHRRRVERALLNNHDTSKLDQKNQRVVLLSDNPGFDFGWLNFELHHKIGKGLLGHSARRIGDAWAGLRKRAIETQGWKKLRVAPHDHTPLNDAMGNAEAWLKMWELYGG